RPCRPAAAFRRSISRPRLLRLGLAQPVLAVLRRAPEDPLEDILPVLHRLRDRVAAFGPDLQLAQAGEHGLHRLVGIDEELASAPSRRNPRTASSRAGPPPDPRRAGSAFGAGPSASDRPDRASGPPTSDRAPGSPPR